jgi:hypothetical protein
MPIRLRVRAFAVLACALLTACAAPAADTFQLEMREPVPSPENACEEAYLAWISAEYPKDNRAALRAEMYYAEYLDPIYNACTVAELAEASRRYPWKAYLGSGSTTSRWKAEMGSIPRYIAEDRRKDCHEHTGSRLCLDIASRER